MLSPDQVSNVDALDRQRFAAEIARNILQHFNENSESLVIGLHGPWGSGKSTLLAFIKESISSQFASMERLTERPDNLKFFKLFRNKQTFRKEQLYILDFNPWIFSGKEQLHSIFLNEFALKVQNKKHKLRKKIEAFAKGLQWFEDLSSWGSVAKKTINNFGEVSIEKLKDETNQILVDENIRVVIIIDDIDRLSPTEILEIFQLVKLNANFKNTLFLLSFDKSIVCNSIFHQFHLDGEKYLEKIIQVDYSLPSILPEEIESMFFKRMDEFIKASAIDFDTASLNAPWLINGLSRYFKNIRDLNRYFNSVSFRLTTIHSEVNIHDFLILEAIRLFDYNIYEIIRDNFRPARQFGEGSKFQAELDSLEGNPSQDLYLYLFKKSYQYSRLKEERYRIFDLEFFDRYFSLTISKKDMREEEFNNFVLHPPTRAHLLDDIIKNGKIEFLLRRLATKSDAHQGTDLMSAISSLLSVWGNYHTEFVDHWRSLWNALKAIISATSDPSTSFRKLLDELNMTTSDFSPARFVFLWLVIQNIYREDDKNIDKDLESYRELLSARKEHLERTWKAALENYQPHFFFSDTFPALYERIYLPSFAKYHPDKYKQQFFQLINDDRKIFKLLNMFVYRDSGSKEPFGIDPKHLPVMLPSSLREEFEKKLAEMNLKALTNEDAKTIRAFQTFLKENVDPLIGRRKV
jgi:hypothetical protein